MNKDLAANATLSHYRIASRIGAGEMGEVYLARGAQLSRDGRRPVGSEVQPKVDSNLDSRQQRKS